MRRRTGHRPIAARTLRGAFVAALAAGAAASMLAGPGRAQPERAATIDALAEDLERRLAEDVAPIMARYCFRCHGEATVKGGVRFEGARTIGPILAMADDWRTAREMVTAHAMPPEGEPAPSEHERLAIVQWIDDALAYYPPQGPIDPGWFTIHRLNRAEYRNTLRDLLGLDPARVDVAAGLPPDDTGYGFDNIADVLSMSPLQYEQFLDAAERAIEIALGAEITVGRARRAVRPLEPGSNGRPLRAGGHMLFSNGAVRGTVDVPLTGPYELAVTAWGTPGGEEDPRLSLRVDGREVGAFFVPQREGSPGEFAVEVRLEAGRREIAAAFTNDYYVPQVADRNLAIESIAIAGPLSTDGLERPAAWGVVLGSSASGEAGAREVLSRFASRAFRRPARAHEVNALLRVYRESHAAGDSHERSLRVALSAILTHPAFLYRIVENPRPDDPGAVHRLGDYELASRLSYFIWSSMPDDELLRLAAEGRLSEEPVLRAQARRMLADPRSSALVENFAGQWLLLRNLERLEVDRARYPAYTPELRRDMVREVLLFVEDVVRNDRSVLDLLDSRDTFMNGRLASHYGVRGVRGEEFRRVELDEASPRGGVLTMAAVLTVTSNPSRTSPVKRGLFVLDQVLGVPPPPPPPDVGPLEQAAAELAAGASMREQLAAHLTNATCASCHKRMDPIGLSLENFDAIGRWRDRDGDVPIDSAGQLPGGEALRGPNDLKRILLGRDEQFVENVSRRLLTYALGRGAEPFDRPTILRVAAEVRSRGDRFSALVEAVVASEAFRSCRGRRVGP